MTLRRALLARSWGLIPYVVDILVGGMSSGIRSIRTVLFFLFVLLLAALVRKAFDLTYWVSYLFSFFVVFFSSWAFFLGRILLFYPFPSCRNGKCSSIDDYTSNWGSLFGREKWGLYCYKCGCGLAYVRVGKRFMEVLPDGTRRSYKRLVGCRKWIDDV